MPPFERKNEKGFKDSIILSTLAEIADKGVGWTVIFITKDKISDYDVSNIEYKIKKFQPDLLFSTNDMALDSKGKLLDLYKKLGIDLGCWFVDEPGFTFSEPWLSIFRHDLIKLFMIDRSWVESAKSVGISNVRHLPLATNIDRFKSSGFTEYDNNERFESDITFVGSLGADKIKYFLNHIKNMNLPNFSRFVELINAAGERYLNDYKTSIEDHLYKIIHESHTDLKELIFDADKNGLLKSVYFLIDFMASFKKRKDIVTSLVDLGITVYGEKEWENFIPKECMGNLPGTNENFPINYYGNELAKIYYRSKINVNVTKFQLKTTNNLTSEGHCLKRSEEHTSELQSH